MELDPTNADAHALETTARERKHIRRKEWIEEERAEQFQRQIELADRHTIPHQQYLIYPSNWSEVARRTGDVSRVRVEEPWKEEIRRRLSRRVSFEFVDTPLQEALTFLNTLSRVNLILDPKAAAAGAGQVKITLRVTDMDMQTALSWILRLADLVYDLRNQAVFITSKANLASAVDLEIYDVRDLTTTLTDFPAPRLELSAQTAGAGGTPGAVTFVQPAAVPTVTAPDLAAMIKDQLLQADFADPATSIEEQAGKLVVMQRPEVHEKIREILRSFRESQTVQVLTQVRFIDANEGFLEQIGVHFGGLDSAVNDPGLEGPALGQVSPWYGLAAQGNYYLPSRWGLYPMGGGPGAVNPAPNYYDTPFQFDTTYGQRWDIHPRLGYNFPGTPSAEVATMWPYSTPYGATGFRKQIGASQLFQALTSNVLNNLGSSGPLSGALTNIVPGVQGALFQFRFFHEIQASALLHALRKEQTNDVLLATRLMQFNNQRSHILVATQRSYIYDYDISGATWDPIIRALTTGVVLEMKPTVSHDRKYITLDLRPGVATLISIEIEVIGGLVSLPIHLPLIELRFVNTTVTVPDQGTLLFSGLINDRKWDGKTGVPFFSDLPVIGRIFSANVKHRERRNLLILVNSRVVLFDEEEEKL
jgi:hypothetical protein